MKKFALIFLTFAGIAVAANVIISLQIGQVVATYADTNFVYVVGSTAVDINGNPPNGKFGLFSRVIGTLEVWTNEFVFSGRPVAAVCHDVTGGVFGDSAWVMTNWSGSIIYDSTEYDSLGLAPGHTPWSNAGGGSPIPTVLYGTNSVSQTTVTTAPYVIFPMPAFDTNWIFVATNGNDVFARYGRMDLPCQSLTYAITNFARAGATIFVGPGYYELSNYPANFQLPGNFTLRGSGRGTTFIHGKDNGAGSASTFFYCGNTNIFNNFSIAHIVFYDSITANTTNVIMEDIDAVANGDVVVLDTGKGCAGFTCINCRFGGNSDKIADLSAGASFQWMTNYFLTAINCKFEGGPGQDGDGLNILSGFSRKQFINCMGPNSQPINTCTNFTTTFQTIKRPALIRTNWVSGQLYTNVYPVAIFISGGWSNIVQSVAGCSKLELWCYVQGAAANVNGFTQYYGEQTVVGLTSVTNSGSFSEMIPSQFVYTFTNQSVGPNNAAGPKGGQMYIP